MSNNKKYASEGNCVSIVWSLLRNLTSSSKITPTVFVRELFQTEYCDQFMKSSALSDLRKDYKDYLDYDDNTIGRIIRFEQTSRDEMKCQQALIHYKEWTKLQLESQLPLSSRIYHRLVSNAERTIDFIDITAFGWTTVKRMPKIVENSSKEIREQKNSESSE